MAVTAELSWALEVVGFLNHVLPVGQKVLNRPLLGVIGDLTNFDRLSSYRPSCDQTMVAERWLTTAGWNTLVTKCERQNY
jgi:hypothetical protein